MLLNLRDISAPVRRRSLFVFRVLSAYEPALLDRIGPTVVGMLEDAAESVVKAALTILRDHPFQVSYAHISLWRGLNATKDEQAISKGKSKANEMLATESSLVDISNIGLIIECLKTIKVIG